MTNFRLLYFFVCLQIFPLLANAQNLWDGYSHLFLPTRSYVVYQTIDPIILDGKANETSWENAVWTELFQDIEGLLKPQPAYQTRVKMLWDKQCLYLLAELEEPHIWAYYRQHDQIVYHENDFEVFIDPDCDSHNYFEFEVNAANTLFDLFLPKPYRNGGNPLLTWDAQGFKSAVSVDGTLNDPKDQDKKWTVEMAIPFSSLQSETIETPVPGDGEIWKIDFSRVEWQTEIVDGKYQKKKDDRTGKFLSENNWVWNATGEVNMHVPERWGMLQFSKNRVNAGKVQFLMPEEEEFKKILWLVYYKQMDFRGKHKQYAAYLSKLEVPETLSLDSGKKVKIQLSCAGDQFKVTLTPDDDQAFTINESGLLEIVI